MASVLSTLPSLKLHLGVANDSQDDKLQQWLDQVESAVLRWTRRNLIKATYTEYHDGGGRSAIPLKHRPVTGTPRVWLDQSGYYGQAPGAFAAPTELTLGVDFIVNNLEANENNPALLILISGGSIVSQHVPDCVVWPNGVGNVKAVYDGGYAPQSIPGDLELAVNQLCASVMNGVEKGGPIQSETIGRYAYSLLSGQQTGWNDPEIGSIRSLLSRYKEVNV